MSLEMIKIIYAAEEDARQAKAQVVQNARDALDETHRNGAKTLAMTLARAEAEIAHLIRASDQKATEDAKELASTTANRMATMRARAERRLDAAAQMIVERIVNA